MLRSRLRLTKPHTGDTRPNPGNAANGLSRQEAERREFVLNGSMHRVVPAICFPLVVYQGFNQLFKVIDNVMASHIGAVTVSAVAYLTQINQVILAVGGGLAAGGSILVSRYYGAGEFDYVRRLVNVLFGLCGILSVGILLMIPVAPAVLSFFGTPDTLAEEGTGYFIIGLFDIVIVFFNNIYIALERARGNSKKILRLNIISIIVKFILTSVFVYVCGFGINMIAAAGIAANLCILIPGMRVFLFDSGPFSLHIPYVKFKKHTVQPVSRLSFPVITEKASFAVGKIAVNSMSTRYGAETVGALGITNNISGFVTSLQNGFQDGCSSIISQNLGAGTTKRALHAFRIALMWNLLVGVTGYTVTMLFLPQISRIFAPEDLQFAGLIAHIYRYEASGIIPLGANATFMALLYGFGYTRLTLCVNFSRVLVFRVPLLWLLQHFTDLGSESVGIVMMTSNILVTLLSGSIVAVVYFKEKKTLQGVAVCAGLL